MRPRCSLDNKTLLQFMQPVLTLKALSNRLQFKCYLCGGNHSRPKECWHMQIVFNRCRKHGYLSKVCCTAPEFVTDSSVTTKVTGSVFPDTHFMQKLQPIVFNRHITWNYRRTMRQ
ncbi:hypothetical protein X801_09857 [Opisthorchis viverrini]|uniref:Uncharacterized protein n=1 Tax=Opisthorchis viverrini TaxID=6198 RepID=A0A1S8WIS9_OPIVI|nr:hypothetical protein X801_09857 [Opisthorchis viverrini]